MSISFPSADFAPTLSGYTGQGAFRFWCQKVLPIVYDDSLSYYELLNKVVNYLNNVISDIDNMAKNIDEISESYTKLQSYVNEHFEEIVGVVNTFTDYINNYFENLDVQEEINNKLNVMASDGTLAELFDPIIRAVTPNIVEEWLETNITPTAPIIDRSLSIVGAGADAFVTGIVGDTVNGLAENLNKNQLSVRSKAPNFKLDSSSTNHVTADANFDVDMYAVEPGDIVYIDAVNYTTGVWCFLTQASVSAGFTGVIYTDGNKKFCRIPEGVYYIGVTIAKDDTSSCVYKCWLDSENVDVMPGVITSKWYSYLNGRYLDVAPDDANKLILKSTSGGYTFAFACEPNTQYTILKPKGYRFVIGASDTVALPKVNDIIERIHMGTRDSLFEVDTNSYDIFGFTTSNTAKYIVVYYYHDSHDEVLTQAEMLSRIIVRGFVLGVNNGYVTPQMFGISGNDPYKHDMSTMFKEMVDYLTTRPDIREIYLPKGDYYGGISVPSEVGNSFSGLVIRGDGSLSGLHSTTFYKVAISIVNSSNIEIKDLDIYSGDYPIKDTPLTEYLAINWRGIYLENSERCVIRNVRMETLGSSIVLDGCHGSEIVLVDITHNVSNDDFNAIDNHDESDPDNPGKNSSYSEWRLGALAPYIHDRIGISIIDSYFVNMTNILMKNIGNGIRIGRHSPANKATNVEIQFALGYAVATYMSNAIFNNLRVDSAGLYNPDNRCAIRIGGDGTNSVPFTQLNNVMVQHSGCGGIELFDGARYSQLTNISLINNSSWWQTYNYHHLLPNGLDYDTATPEEIRNALMEWNPEGWAPHPEIMVGKNATRNNIVCTITCSIMSQKSKAGGWTGYSDGVYFEENADDEMTEPYYGGKVNNVEVMFGYDFEDPDGDNGTLPGSIKNAIVPYNVVPIGNRFTWNCVELGLE